MQHTLLLIDGDGARVHPTRPGYYPIVSPKSSICKGGFRELRQRYVDNWPKDTIVPHGGSHQWREPCYLKAPARFVFFLPYRTHAAVCAQLVEKKCLASSPPTFRTVTAPQGANAVAIFLTMLAPTPPSSCRAGFVARRHTAKPSVSYRLLVRRLLSPPDGWVAVPGDKVGQSARPCR